MQKIKIFLFFISIIFSNTLYSIDISDIKNDARDGKFDDACNKAGAIFSENSLSETYLNLFAFSCTEAGFLDRVFLSIVNLTQSEDARDNSLYYQTILYKKALIVSMILDKKNYSTLSLPKTAHILDFIFTKLQNNQYSIEGENYKIKDENFIFEVGVLQRTSKNTLYINKYRDNSLIKSYIFK